MIDLAFLTCYAVAAIGVGALIGWLLRGAVNEWQITKAWNDGHEDGWRARGDADQKYTDWIEGR